MAFVLVLKTDERRGYCRGFEEMLIAVLGEAAVVVSHPCGEKKPQGWGVEICGGERD